MVFCIGFSRGNNKVYAVRCEDGSYGLNHNGKFTWYTTEESFKQQWKALKESVLK